MYKVMFWIVLFVLCAVLLASINLQSNYDELKYDVDYLTDEVWNKNSSMKDMQGEIDLLTALLNSKEKMVEELEESLRIEKERVTSLSVSLDSSPRVMTMTATAYTAYCKGCIGITKTGQNLRKNPHLKVIAVDPKVIPLGSRVYVEGYGEALAGDTGGAIKGDIIDVFIPKREEALKWGRRTVKVIILN